MANNRIIYACQALAIAKTGHGNADTPEFEVMKGVQNVGISSNFTLEAVFEYGQAELYANVEDLATVEITIEKLIDGEKLLYLQAVGEIGKTNVISASTSKCDVYLAIFPDTVASISGQTRDHVVYSSGMQVSSVGFTYPVDGNATESLTVQGNDKFWDAVTAGYIETAPNTLFGTAGGSTGDALDGTDTPASGIVRRAKFDLAGSTLPAEVESQTNPTAGSFGIQNVSVNLDFSREDQLELGRFGPYNQTAQTPFEVTSEFEVTGTNGDLISHSGAGSNTTARSIIIQDTAGTVLNLGAKNRLSGITQQGGGTDGGNATITFSYTTYNSLLVQGGGTYWT